jgi:hypothetical protein
MKWKRHKAHTEDISTECGILIKMFKVRNRLGYIDVRERIILKLT